jgi:hypothetical protein
VLSTSPRGALADIEISLRIIFHISMLVSIMLVAALLSLSLLSSDDCQERIWHQLIAVQHDSKCNPLTLCGKIHYLTFLSDSASFAIKILSVFPRYVMNQISMKPRG